MRYDTPVYFRTVTPGMYDSTTGDYADDSVAETKKYASVVGTSAETMRLVYGEIREGSVTIHLQNKMTQPFSQIRIGDRVYAVDKRIPLRSKEAFILSEVMKCPVASNS